MSKISCQLLRNWVMALLNYKFSFLNCLQSFDCISNRNVTPKTSTARTIHQIFRCFTTTNFYRFLPKYLLSKTLTNEIFVSFFRNKNQLEIRSDILNMYWLFRSSHLEPSILENSSCVGAETFSESCQISKVERLAKIVNR